MVYGDFLACFPELFQNITCFKQLPKVGAGYDVNGEPFLITGIVQSGAGDYIGKGSSESGGSALTEASTHQLWTYDNVPFRTYFIIDDEIYVVGKKKDWIDEAGFNVYNVDMVVGDNGSQSSSLPRKRGTF